MVSTLRKAILELSQQDIHGNCVLVFSGWKYYLTTKKKGQ